MEPALNQFSPGVLPKRTSSASRDQRVCSRRWLLPRQRQECSLHPVLLGLLSAAVPQVAQTGCTCTRRDRTSNKASWRSEKRQPAGRYGDVQLHRPGACRRAGRARPQGRPYPRLPRREQFAQKMQSGGITTTGLLLAAGIEVRIKGGRGLTHLKAMPSMDACSVLAPPTGHS